jgi:hypothetical protein
MMDDVGALVTLQLPPDSDVLDLPWIITFGPLTDEEDWEPVVCGPYEHAHALALAEEVVADEELMAVVEPVMAFVSPDQVRAEIATAKATAAEVGDDIDDSEFDDEVYTEDEHDHDDHDDHDHDDHGDTPKSLPGPDEIRAGMVRLAHRMASAG